MPATQTTLPAADTIDIGRAWAAVLARDASARGFVYAVTTTGVFCRSGCASRSPVRENVRFFATSDEARRAGFRPCQRCRPEEISSDARLTQTMAAFLDRNSERRVPLAELGRIIQRSPFTAQRIFRRTLGVTPAQYQRQSRAATLRDELHSGQSNATDAVYAAGYSGPSRAYESADFSLGMPPGDFRRNGRDQTIRYSTGPSPLGILLIARTERGICAVALGNEPEALIADLRQRFHAATLLENSSLTSQIAAISADLRENPAALLDLPLDLRATAFQMRVWETLRHIPPGQTRTYAQVAREIGQPSAVRAVARACASNPAALLVPCHRVIGSDGKLTGYRWGLDRKKRLLALESQQSATVTPKP